MKFTLITPCRNSADLLEETVRSILTQTALADGTAELQYLILDGASTDGTAEWVKELNHPSIQFISEPDRGMYDALAKGLRQAEGDIVAYLNAGDTFFPQAFGVLREAFFLPGVDWVTGYACLMNDASQITATWKPPRYRREFVQNGTYVRGFPYDGIQQECTFWSGRANRTLNFDHLAQCRLAGDYFIWTQLAKSYELHSLMTLLGAFRQHEGQLSEQREAYLEEARSFTRPATRRERLTAWWEYRANSAIKKYFWNHLLPPSPARLIEYSAESHSWLPR